MWWDRQQSAVRWRIHRPMTRIERTLEFRPLRFQNASVLWVNTLSDEIDLSLVDATKPTMGETSIDSLQMLVYDDPNRTNVAEIYHINVDDIHSGNATFLQNDVHLSPFRRLVVYPKLVWNLGMGACDWCFPRRGSYVNGWWVEPLPWRWVPWVFVWSIGMLLSKRSHTGRRIRTYY